MGALLDPGRGSRSSSSPSLVLFLLVLPLPPPPRAGRVPRFSAPGLEVGRGALGSLILPYPALPHQFLFHYKAGGGGGGSGLPLLARLSPRAGSLVPRGPC